MKMNIRWNEVLKKNFFQVFFVLAAFLIMILTSYLFVSAILRNRLLTNADDILFGADANMRAALAEAEISLNTSFPIVLGMIQQDVPREEILDYLRITTAWMRENRRGLIKFYGIYGYIRGEFLSGIDFEPDENYHPQIRPWYQTAVRSGDTAVVYTAPHLGAWIGDTIISAVKNIVDEEGNFRGILALDMSMEWISGYIKTLRLGEGGYGIVVSQNMVVLAHPEDGAVGKQLQELGEPFEDISRRLRVGEELSAVSYRDSEGHGSIVFFKRMFNGWYVGLITPVRAYYRDLYNAAFILSILGFILMCSLSYLLLRINAAKMKADENSLSKSNFLARMSHEIRTPMNAILGMTELILRKDLAPDAYDNAQNIKQAGSSLLSIINDILDFSKIESGKLDIINADYQFASVVNDVIAIIRMRLNEKPVRLITRIDGSLPAVLTGDEARVRQVLLNLLSNAVKYTREGSITLSIHREDQGTAGEEDLIRLAFEVADTGIGIRKEDLEKLFGNFVQLDREQNRGVEGTGLGLAISRNLCLLMGGDLTVESVYGEGSVFTALIPQRVKDKSPFALVKDPETKRVLIYENRSDYVESVIYSLNNLGVDCAFALNRDDFAKKLAEGGWRFIFASPSLLEEVREVLQGAHFESGEEPALALLTEYGQAARPDMLTLFMPLHPLTMADILNGNRIENTYHEIETPGIRFTAPDARILLVDDIETNLDVAEGLLSPYKMMISRATGGREAVQLVKENNYDIVFMDHMMPGMDGIEATAAIRDWEESCSGKKTTIIALTANAISGMKEMFLEKGFDDYISKPIEIARLDEIVSRWIPLGKRRKTGPRDMKREIFSGRSGIVIPGVDVARGINMTGGAEEGYRKVLRQFCRDAAERLNWFRGLSPPARIAPQAALVATQAHAIKSAAGTIGALEIATDAATLEAAGIAGDAGRIGEILPGFCKRLGDLIEAAEKVLEAEEVKEAGPNEAEGTVLQSLAELRSALKAKNMKEIDRLLEELEKARDPGIRNRMNAVSDKVLMGEYAEAILAMDGEQVAGRR